MERIISTDSIEYKNYIDEITLFFKEKNSLEESIQKELQKGKDISKIVKNINYYIDDEGNFIKSDNNEIILKIIKPKYIDIFERIEILNDEKEKYRSLLIKLRQEILNNSDEKLQKYFETNKELYDSIEQEITELKNYFSKINNSELIKEELDKLEIEKDKYQENLRLIFSQLKLLSSDTKEWKNLTREYLSQDKNSDRYKFKQINEKISKLSKIIFYEKNENELTKDYLINPGRLIIEPVLSAKLTDKQEVIPIETINFKITSNPIIETSSKKEKKKTVTLKKKEESILFNSRIKEYKFLSNFSNSPFHSVLYGYPENSEKYNWPTVEHYFQASKFTDPGENNLEYAKEILKQKTPALAKRLGNNINPSNGAKIRGDWNDDTDKHLNNVILKTKDLVMMKAIKEKFSQNLDIQEYLLNTISKKLIESSQTDNYWGNGRDGDGLNMLGKIIMNYRNQLNTKKNFSIEDSESELEDKIILKKKNKQKSPIKDSNEKSSLEGGKSILKLKGTKKNRQNIGWINEDSLGNKLNDSNYELDKNIEKLDLNSLDLNIMDSENSDINSINLSEINFEDVNIDIERGSKIEIPNLSTIDLDNIDSGDIKQISINDLNRYENEDYRINNLEKNSNNKSDIKNINISKQNSSTKYFSDIEIKNNEDIDLINLLDNKIEDNNVSDIKNIKIKIR